MPSPLKCFLAAEEPLLGPTLSRSKQARIPPCPRPSGYPLTSRDRAARSYFVLAGNFRPAHESGNTKASQFPLPSVDSISDSIGGPARSSCLPSAVRSTGYTYHLGSWTTHWCFGRFNSLGPVSARLKRRSR